MFRKRRIPKLLVGLALWIIHSQNEIICFTDVPKVVKINKKLIKHVYLRDIVLD